MTCSYHKQFNHWHNSEEQNHETCEVSYADDINNSIKKHRAWKSDKGDGEASQCVDAGSASASSPTQKTKRICEELKYQRVHLLKPTGWFHWFKVRANLNNIKVSGEADTVRSADTIAAQEFPETL